MGTRTQLICDKCGEDINKEKDSYVSIKTEHGTDTTGVVMDTIADQEHWAICFSCWQEIVLKVDLGERIEVDKFSSVSSKEQIKSIPMLREKSKKFS